MWILERFVQELKYDPRKSILRSTEGQQIIDSPWPSTLGENETKPLIKMIHTS